MLRLFQTCLLIFVLVIMGTTTPVTGFSTGETRADDPPPVKKESVESLLKQLIERLDRQEQLLKKLIDQKNADAKIGEIVELGDGEHVPTWEADGYIWENRGVKVVKVAIDDPLAEANIEGRMPAWARDVWDKIKTMEEPEKTYRARQLRSMLKLPSPKNQTRQQVLDGLPKGDPLYNFTAKEWAAIDWSDEEWLAEYGTDPKRRDK